METEQRESEILRTTIFEDMNPELRDRDNDIDVEGDTLLKTKKYRGPERKNPHQIEEESGNLSRTYNFRRNVRVPERLGQYYSCLFCFCLLVDVISFLLIIFC